MPVQKIAVTKAVAEAAIEVKKAAETVIEAEEEE